MDEPAYGIRLDIWLWAARLFRTRALAKQAIEAGRVEIGGVACKPARLLRVGDALSVRRGEERFQLEVRALASRRGPAVVAQALYAESPESRAHREAEQARIKAERAGYEAPAGKPDKRARRLIRALGDIDTL